MRRFKSATGRHATCGVLVTLLGLTILAPACIADPPDPREEFARLEAQMEQAQEAFFSAVEALEAQKRGEAKKTNPAAKPPYDGRGDILKRMDALLDSAAGAPGAGYVGFETFMWSLEVEPGKALSRFEKLAKRFPNEVEFGDLLFFVPDVYAESGTVAGWIKALKGLAESTKNKDNRFGAFLAKGRIELGSDRLASAKRSFEQVLKLGPDPDVIQTTKGYIFEIEHLQVGMAAPDFTTKTVDGKDVSLKSLRGNAVLLDYWATW